MSTFRSFTILHPVRKLYNQPTTRAFSNSIGVPRDTYWRKKPNTSPAQKYDFFYILDFEATCDNVQKLNPQEIIEIPCLRLNRKTMVVDTAFHEYVRPLAHPQLTPFCVQLTGILQETVDKALPFPQVWNNFNQWLKENKESGESSIFITSGSWDLGFMLPQQLQYSQISPSDDFRSWIDLKKAFAKGYDGRFPFGIKDMLKSLSLPHGGKLHSGMDDCINIVNIVKKMLNDQIILDKTDTLKS